MLSKSSFVKFQKFSLAAIMVFWFAVDARSQHLWWNLEHEQKALCLYGEITVLATYPSVYYCGANWHPGEAAGGYCGIQDNSMEERRTIFSIWDTSPKLHPQITEADPQTLFNRFGGEGEGGHTHMLWPWKVGETFQFFVQKEPDPTRDATVTRYYIFDIVNKKWLHSATIVNPNGGHQSVGTLGGGVNSFLENFGGQDKDKPKLALYRLWLGATLDTLKCLTNAVGDGKWGRMHDAYFMCEGETGQLNAVFSKLESKYGQPEFGQEGKPDPPISSRPVPTSVLAALKNLPRAPKAMDKP